jgi:hypothetical protein
VSAVAAAAAAVPVLAAAAAVEVQLRGWLPAAQLHRLNGQRTYQHGSETACVGVQQTGALVKAAAALDTGKEVRVWQLRDTPPLNNGMMPGCGNDAAASA